MLQVDIRSLDRGPVETPARVAPDDPLFEGLAWRLAAPLEVEGRLQATADGEYFWRALLRGTARGECRRCLVPVDIPVEVELQLLFSSDPEAADDPSVYPLSPAATKIDLAPAVREELLLAVPPWVECRPDCAGLCARCGADLNAGPCACARAAAEA